MGLGDIEAYMYQADLHEDQEERVDHADYPHEPGTLYDCEACESRCHCDHLKAQYDPGYTQCVFCAMLQERHQL